MDLTCFAVEIKDRIAGIKMNRPDKANSMVPAFWTELPELIGEIDGDGKTRVAVLSGEGKHFTSGMDLSAFAGLNALGKDAEPGRARAALRNLIQSLQDTFTSLEAARMPVIAAIHGACLGGGMDLITACDLRYCTEDAFFAIEEINIGMTADVGTLQRLPALVSLGVARDWAYSGRRISAEEARERGLINGVFADHAAMMDAVDEIAAGIAAKSPLAVWGTKEMLTHARDNPVSAGLDHVATWNSGMLQPADMMEAMAARQQKRAGKFDDLLPIIKSL